MSGGERRSGGERMSGVGGGPPDDAALAVAIAAARAAGAVLRDAFEGELTIEHKSSEIDLVTTADRAAEAVVLEHLRRAFPDDAIVAEESGAHVGGARRWIVDPLDGTTNFAHRFPHFSVSIACYVGDVGLVGVVYDPLRDELFAAAAGHGAWLDSPRHDHVRLSVTSRDRLATSLLATGFGYDRASTATNNLAEFNHLLPQVRGIRRPGSAALDLAYAAAGRTDGYWEYHLAPWDWAAGALLVGEAGGVVTRMDGGPWTLDAPSIAVAGAALHPALLRELQAASAAAAGPVASG